MVEITLTENDEALDLPVGVQLRTSKALDRVDELGRITQEAALSLSLPATPHNRRLLAAADPNVLSGAKYDMSVKVRQDGQEQGLTAISLISFHQRDGYEAEPYGEDWQEALDLKMINQLDLGSITWNRSTIRAAWEAPRGDAPLLPLLCHYGKFRAEDQIKLEDLRIWVSYRHLLETAFRSIGWTLVCPHLTEGDGRYYYGYLGGKRWHYHPGKAVRQYAVLGIEEATSNASDRHAQLPWQIVEDGDGRIAPNGNYLYDPEIEGEPTVRVQVELDIDFSVQKVASPQAVSTPFVEYRILQYNTGETATERFRDTLLIPFGEGLHRQRYQNEFYLEVPVSSIAAGFSNVSLRPFFQYLGVPGEEYGVDPFAEYGEIYVHSATLTYRPDPSYYGRGVDIEAAAGLDPEVSCLDVLLGIAHLTNAKFSTDLARREVRMDVPFSYRTTNPPERTVPGFYERRRAPLDFRNRTEPNSLRWQRIEQREQGRYVVYDFASDNDEAVTDADRERFRRRVDRGQGDKGRTDKRPNPLLEPTRDVELPPEQTGEAVLTVPALWEKGRGTLSHELGPRIVVYYGLADLGGAGWMWEGYVQGDYPAASMYQSPPRVDLATEPVVWDGYANDLFQRFYRREVMARDVTLEVLLSGGDRTYDAIDFRRLLLVRTEDGDLEIQPTAVRDHPRGSQVPLLVEGYSTHNSY